MQRDNELVYATRELAPRHPRPTSNKVVRYLTPVLQIEESSPPLLARLTVIMATLALIMFVAWAAMAPFKEIAVGRGEVLPEGFVQPVQHVEGGKIAQLLAVEGQRLKAGDPIVTLDDTAVRLELEHARTRRLIVEGSIARLQAFADGKEPLPPDQPRPLGPNEQLISLDAQAQTRSAQLRAAQAETDSRRQSVIAARVKMEKLAEELVVVRESLTRREPLLRAGLVRLPEMEALRRDRVRLESEWARTSNELASAESSVQQAEARYTEIVARARQDAMLEILRLRVEASEANSAEQRFADRLQRLIVRAPVDGHINQMSVRSSGAVLPAGGTVGEIVPAEATIFAEVEVSPDDVGHVQPGMPALVKVSTFDFSRFGGVPGTVDSVSPTSLKRPNAPPVFRVRIRLETDYVGPRTSNMRLRPGMLVTADIRTGQKTLLAYLLKPVHTAFATALSER